MMNNTNINAEIVFEDNGKTILIRSDENIVINCGEK